MGVHPILVGVASYTSIKKSRGAMIPLRTDLVDALHAYIDDLQARVGVKPLRHDTHLFPMPREMIRVFGRDLSAASIPKHDPRGRVVDLHALRHTFGTHLARAGVARLRYASE